MEGGINSWKLIRSMKPVLNDGEYVFCSFKVPDGLALDEAICTFRESEGVSVILPKAVADQNRYDYSFIASWITLTIHSSLDAIGLTAAVSRALADNNISANVVAGYHHDHVFVPRRDAERAMRVLGAVRQ